MDDYVSYRREFVANKTLNNTQENSLFSLKFIAETFFASK